MTFPGGAVKEREPTVRWGDSPFDPSWRRYPSEAASDAERWIPAYSPASSTEVTVTVYEPTLPSVPSIAR